MEDGQWSLAKRVGFRVAFVIGALYVFPFPLGYLPRTDWLAEPLGKPMAWLTRGLGESVLGLRWPATEDTGSGDTLAAWVTMLTIVILGVVGGAIWSAIDRRRPHYARLAGATHVALRYLLATTMVAYGFAKIAPLQFPALDHAHLDSRLGDLPPMSLLWTFMGYSRPYAIFGGLAEAVGGVLLLWRRTATLGALIVIAVMTNVVMLNLCYDVPVKLYATQLVVIAAVIAAPQLLRLGRALLGFAVPAVPARRRGSTRYQRARLGVKVALIAGFAVAIYLQIDEAGRYRPAPGPLAGIWVVDTWQAGGVVHPPLTTDDKRWRKVIFDSRRGQLRMMDDARQLVRTTFDPAAHTIAVTQGETTATWRYVQPDPTHLVIDGAWGGAELHVTMTREPAPVLVTRGFHWVQEVPYNW